GGKPVLDHRGADRALAVDREPLAVEVLARRDRLDRVYGPLVRHSVGEDLDLPALLYRGHDRARRAGREREVTLHDTLHRKLRLRDLGRFDGVALAAQRVDRVEPRDARDADR